MFRAKCGVALILTKWYHLYKIAHFCYCCLTVH